MEQKELMNKIAELSDAEFKKATFIQVRSKDTLADVDADLRLLEEKCALTSHRYGDITGRYVGLKKGDQLQIGNMVK